MEFDKARKQQIVFVDSQVKDCEILTKSTNSDTEVIVLKGDRDGIEQIAETLKQHKNIAAVHILSHGAAASVQIGATELNLSNIETYRDRLEKWFALPAEVNSNSRITAKPEILLYGCNVAATEAGVAFVQRLSQLTGAEVAASDNLTGNAALGGDWELEVSTGKIETALAFSPEAREAYSGVLVATFATLRDAITLANALPDTDTIAIDGNITLAAGDILPRISNPITFTGGGFTVNLGNNRGFFLDGGAVSFSNLTITGGRALGGAGTAGGGGAAGMGGALFINSGTVTVNSVTFNGNSAIGGTGAAAAAAAGPGGNTDFANLFPFVSAGGTGQAGLPGLASIGAAGGPGGPGGNGGAGSGGLPGTGLNGGIGGAGGVGGAGTAGTNGGVGGTGGVGGIGGLGGGGGGGGAAGNGGVAGTGTAGNGGVGGIGGAAGFGGGGGAGGAGGAATAPGGLAGAAGNGGAGGFGGGGGSGAVGGASTAVGGFTAGGAGSAASGGGGAGLGGAIFVNTGGSLALNNSTLFSNTATGGLGATPGAGAGAAIFVNNGATATLTNNTITANTAAVTAPAVANGGGIATNGGTVNVRNSIVAGNTGGASPDVFGAFAATSTNNSIGSLVGSTGFAATQQLAVPLTNVIAATAALNQATAVPVTYALADSTATVTNPAINGGSNALAVGTTDERGTGFPRTIGASVDIGAYEYGPIVTGVKFNDFDGDSLKGAIATEPGLPGWVISVGTKSATTAADGTYTIRDVKTNTAITEAPPAGTPATDWVQTVAPTPASTGVIDVTGANFGNFKKTTIAGKTYTDLLGNKVLDLPADTTLNGVTVSLYKDTNGDGIFQTATDTIVGAPVTTAVAGDYLFPDIGPGKYLIQATAPVGSSISFPAAAIPVTALSGTPVTAQNFGIFKNITISGTKFEDKNNNATLDTGEVAPATPFEIQLVDAIGTVKTQTTDATGKYTFADVGPGTYTLREVPQDGWLQTLAPTGIITANSGTPITDKNFGNFQKPNSISGLKFNDINGNAVQNTDELGLPNWEFFLDLNDNNIFDTGETKTVTDAAGKYKFIDLPAGTYKVREILQTGWVQTTPDPSDITVVRDQNIVNVNFGNFQPATIGGQKFNDANNNGTKDAGETGLANWQIFLDSINPDGIFQQGEPTTITDATGNYTLGNIPAGTYQVREVQQTGWTQTTPNPAAVAVKSGDNITGVNFGNFLPQPGTIRGLKFRDGNNNGIQDTGEVGLPNIQIQLTNVTPGVVAPIPVTTTTDNSGNYLFTNLTLGTYRVREVVPVGFTQSTPVPADIALTSGAIVSNINFGNFPTPTPIPTPTPTPTPTPVIPTPTPTPAPAPTPTPSPAPTPTPAPVPTPTPAPAPLPTPSPEPTPTPSPEPTPTPSPEPTDLVCPSDFPRIDPPNLPAGSAIGGPNGDDTIVGSAGSDSIFGLGGNDLIFGQQGGDYINGNTGNDTIYGGINNDTLFGGKGFDLIFGDRANDTIYGNRGNDSISGDGGDDLLYGGKGDDVILGGAGDDALIGDLGNDTLCGGDGNNSLVGASGDDVLFGGSSDELLFGGSGNDTLIGGDGGDNFVLGSGGGTDIIIDFTPELDALALIGGLDFNQLSLTETNGSTAIAIAGTNEILAILRGVQPIQLSAQDFNLLV